MSDTLFEDHRLETAKRGYDDVLDYTILRDDLPADVVHALLDTTTANFDIVSSARSTRAHAAWHTA